MNHLDAWGKSPHEIYTNFWYKNIMFGFCIQPICQNSQSSKDLRSVEASLSQSPGGLSVNLDRLPDVWRSHDGGR